MPSIKVFPTTQALPSGIKQQILDFLRINYPEGFMEHNQFRDWTSTPENHPAHIVLIENDRLISHTEILWKLIDHNGVTYKVYGLSGVMTYPEFRGYGYGTQIIAVGTDYIRETDADVGMFHCDSALRPFYERVEWIPMATAITHVGARDNPMVSDELLMMMFLSETAQRHREDFETLPIYFGPHTW